MSDIELLQLLHTVGAQLSPACAPRLRARLHSAHHAIRLERLVGKTVWVMVLALITATGVSLPLIESVARQSSLASPVGHSPADWRHIGRNTRRLHRALEGDFSQTGQV